MISSEDMSLSMNIVHDTNAIQVDFVGDLFYIIFLIILIIFIYLAEKKRKYMTKKEVYDLFDSDNEWNQR